MASIIKVTVDDRAIISALNTPGGGVYEWRDEIAKEIISEARATSPVNDPLNALHRGGAVGEYKASWHWDRLGSSGHHVVLRVENRSDHAVFVEWGRRQSRQMQIFSWKAFGGAIVRVGGPNERKPRFNPRTGKMSKLSKKSLRWNEKVAKLPRRVGNKTAAREGEHILGNAVARTLGSQGIAVHLD